MTKKIIISRQFNKNIRLIKIKKVLITLEINKVNRNFKVSILNTTIIPKIIPKLKITNKTYKRMKTICLCNSSNRDSI